MDEIERLKARLEREKRARLEAEALIEERSRQLFQTNQELQQTLDDLEVLVERRTGDLVEAKQRAEAANLAKSQFLAHMSHELRTPLNSILGFAQLLENSTKNPLGERQIRQARQIQTSGQHLLSLIDTVLDLSRIEVGQLNIELGRVDCGALVQECLEMAAPLAAEHDIALGEAPGCPVVNVMVDESRAKQAILYLLSNAIKFNSAGGRVWMDVEARPPRWVRFSVHDTGIGIPPEFHGEIFEPFSRPTENRDEYAGTGIGLTLAKHLIESMDGRIGLFSTPDKGSTFWIELPAATVEDLDSIQTEPHRESAPRETVARERLLLYIEDDPANVSLIEEVAMDVEDLAVISAPTAEIGLALVRDYEPDIVIMDINLPGMNGDEAIIQLKSDPKTSTIPVIGLSGEASLEDIRSGLEMGFDHYLGKPFDVIELITILEQLCDSTSAREL